MFGDQEVDFGVPFLRDGELWMIVKPMGRNREKEREARREALEIIKGSADRKPWWRYDSRYQWVQAVRIDAGEPPWSLCLLKPPTDGEVRAGIAAVEAALPKLVEEPPP